MAAELTGLVQALGPLVGALGGTYFGLKAAVNGMKDRVARIEKHTEVIKENGSALRYQLEAHAKDSDRNQQDMKKALGERCPLLKPPAA